MIAQITKSKRGPQSGTSSPRQAMATASAAWGNDLPEWVSVLATACDRSSQNNVAKKMGYSASVISAVLNQCYKGAYNAVEQTIRGKLMSETLECPILGALKQDICLAHQKRAMNPNPNSGLRMQVSRACRGGCPHSRLPNRNATDGGQDAEQ
jgi:hypothetical protein